MKYSFNEMREQADKIERQLPELIHAAAYATIRDLAFSLQKCWEGKAADAFFTFVNEATVRRDPDMCSRIPELIRSSADNMEERQRQLAEEVRRNFSSLF